MTIAETSLIAYNGLRDTPKLSKRQQQVLAVIDPGRDYSLWELSYLCGLPINSVSGRVTELRREKKILEYGERRPCDITGEAVDPVRLATTNPAEGL